MLPLIPHDKANHYVYGSIIASVTFAIAFNIISVIMLALVIAFVATTIVAVGKELYDKISGKGVPDFYDVVYTIAGGIIVLFPSYLLTHVP
jgi:hypothetical protein